MISTVGTLVSGLGQATMRVAEDATRVVKASSTDQDTAKNLVALNADATNVSALALALRLAQKQTGTLLDITA